MVPTPLPEEEAKFIIKQIMKAVKYFHGQGVVHRDLKPDNILLVGKGFLSSMRETRVKIIDFGLAKATGKEFKLDSNCGTIDFTAPEILEGE